MRAAVITSPGRAIIEEQPRPTPRVGEVRVRLQGCGVCGSNLPPWEGRSWFQYPLAAGAPGHEGWGIVDELGPEVDGIRCGDRVALLSFHAFSEFDVAAAASVVPLPRELNEIPFPGEALGCAMNVFQRCDIRAGQKVAIVGIGFLGALLVHLATRAGARVIALSRRADSLQVAEAMGAEVAVPLDDTTRALAPVQEFTGGAWCDCVIEAAGLQCTLDCATEITRERGRLVIAGYHQDGPRQVNMQLWNWRGIDVINAHERDPQVYRHGMQAAVDAILTGRLQPENLYTHRFSLDELASALDCLRTRPAGFMKGLVVHA